MLDVNRQGRIGIVSLNRPHAAQRDGSRSGRGAGGRSFRRLDADPTDCRHRAEGRGTRLLRRQRLKFIGRLSLEDTCRFEAETGDMARLLGFLRKPVIASVEGFALGGGFILAVSCDLVVSAEYRTLASAGSSDWLADTVGAQRPDFAGRARSRRESFVSPAKRSTDTKQNASVLSIISQRLVTPTRSRSRWRSGWRFFRPRRSPRQSAFSCPISSARPKYSTSRPTKSLPAIAGIRSRARRLNDLAADKSERSPHVKSQAAR